MFKPMFVFTVYPNDIVGINILQSQIYFDIYIAKIIISDQETNVKMLAHLMNIISVTNISQITPLNFTEEDIQVIDRLVLNEYKENIANKYTILQS